MALKYKTHTGALYIILSYVSTCKSIIPYSFFLTLCMLLDIIYFIDIACIENNHVCPNM
jgi:hypothetical protein